MSAATMTATMARAPAGDALPSQRELVGEFADLATPDTARGTLLFAIDVAFYFAALAGVLFAESTLWRWTFSALAGMAQARLMVLAHDAAHGNLVAAARFNRLIAIVALTLIHYNFRLWTYEHHHLHHPSANDRHDDAFTPLGKAEFDALPPWRRLLERIYRAPSGLGFGLYYVIERYWRTKILPPAYVPPRLRRSAYAHSALLIGWLALFGTLLWHADRFGAQVGGLEALLLGIVVPFFVFQCQNGFALYSQHTDAEIPWFGHEPSREGEGRVELLSVYLRTPRPMGWFYHDIFCHSVHHLHPRIPCYHLHAAQQRLCARLGERAIVRDFGPAWLFRTMATCKLYDWERGQWLGFDGRPRPAGR